MLIKFIRNYLREREKKNILLNHVYKDSNGNELIYLGQAFLYDDMVHSTSFITISDYMKHIYLEKNVLDEYPKTFSLSDILLDLFKKYYDGNSFKIAHLIYSEKPIKMKEIISKDERKAIYGDISVDTFHMIFDFNRYVYDYFH